MTKEEKLESSPRRRSVANPAKDNLSAVLKSYYTPALVKSLYKKSPMWDMLRKDLKKIKLSKQSKVYYDLWTSKCREYDRLVESIRELLRGIGELGDEE